MRSHANGLTIDVDCSSFRASECPSMASSFSSLDSPTPTPSSMYSQGSLASPGWHEGGSFPGNPYERRPESTPLRSSFRLADLTNDGMPLPCSNMDSQDRMPVPDYLSGFDENAEQFWIPSEMPKAYENTGAFPFPGSGQYPPVTRNHYRPQHAPYLPESATNPCLSRPMFNQHERMPSSVSMNNMLPWMPPTDSLAPQTITPSQAFPPVTPPPSYSDFPASYSSFQSQTPTTSVRSGSLSTPSGVDTPMSRISGASAEYVEDSQFSPAIRDGLRRPHRQHSQRMARRDSTRQALNLDSLPSIIKQVQFKCKEPGCKGRFKRQEHLKRHMKSHSKEKPHVCWVPGCHRAFSRSDNLNAHYTKTHSKRGGRNRYVATLDETSQDYDPDFRGQLTPDGRPIYGSTLDDPIPDIRELSVDVWDE